MLKKYKNLLLTYIRDNGFDPEQFLVEEKEVEHPLENDNRSSFTLYFLKTPLYFRIWNLVDDYHNFECLFTKFAPNFPDSILPDEKDYFNFNELSNAFVYWLKNHVNIYLEDQVTPDLWSQIQYQGALVNWIPNYQNNKFEDFEKVEIRKSIENVRSLIIDTFKPSIDDKDAVSNRLDYLSESLDRLNRIDWKSILLSTMISISIALTLDTSKGKLLSDLFKQAFSKVLFLIQSF